MKFSFGEVAAAIVVVFGPSAIRANDQLSAGSSSSTGIPCANDTVGWVDVAGDGCDWYEVNDLPGCPHHGNSHDGGSGVANDHCCFCAGTGVSATTRIGLNSFRYSFEDFFLVSRYLTILPSLPTVPRSPEIRPTLRCLSRPPVPRSLEPRR